jgi:hypothetical protein
MVSNSLPLPFVCPVAGVSFRQETVTGVMVGSVIVVRRDPENAYDPQACAVYRYDGHQLGYLPRELASRIESHGPWVGCVVDILPGANSTGLRIRVEAERALGEAEDIDPTVPDVLDDDQPWKVYSKSGRLLGRYLGSEDNLVKVAAGHATALYPHSLVEIRPVEISDEQSAASALL